MTKHLRSLLDLSPAEASRVVDLAVAVKANPAEYSTALAGKSVAMIFAKQSTRTRISFEVGLHQLGAQPLVLSTSGGTGMQMGRGETVADTAKVLSRFVHGIVIRTFGQPQVDGLAEHGSIPVVNALTDLYHPCQALADALTVREHLGGTQGKKLVYVGAGNNVAHSLMLLGPRTGMDVVVACPESLRPNAKVLDRARTDATEAGTRVAVETNLMEAVQGADVLYTDTWVSMGEEEEAKALMKTLAGYTITEEVMKATGKDEAIFMHCLPAHRGDEVSAEVMDGPRSVVFDEAENRLHAQKALMLLLLEGGVVELKSQDLAPKYQRILESCEPYLVTYPANHSALDMRPFGLELPPERIYDPTTLRSRDVIDGLHHLDAFSFGGQEMLMPRWVLFDCGEFPGIVFGFGRKASELGTELRRAYDVIGPSYNDVFVPLSMWVAIRCAEDGGWFGHNLSSSNYVAQTEPLSGLGTITKSYGVKVARVLKQYGATQWASTSIGLHLTLGDMNLLNAYTPAHTHPETFTYRIDATDEQVSAPLRPGWRRPSEGGTRFVDSDNPGAIRALQEEIEQGAKLRLHRVERMQGHRQRLWMKTAE